MPVFYYTKGTLCTHYARGGARARTHARTRTHARARATHAPRTHSQIQIYLCVAYIPVVYLFANGVCVRRGVVRVVRSVLLSATHVHARARHPRARCAHLARARTQNTAFFLFCKRESEREREQKTQAHAVERAERERGTHSAGSALSLCFVCVFLSLLFFLSLPP